MKKVDMFFSKTFIKIFGAYMVVIIFSMSLYLYFYGNSVSFIKKNIIENETENIRQSSTTLDKGIYDIRKFIYNAGKDLSILKQLDTKDQIDYLDFDKLRSFSIQAVDSNPLLEDVIFYVPGTDYFVNHAGSFTFDKFFELNLENTSKNRYFWRDYLQRSSAEEVFPAETYYSVEANGKTVSRELIVLVSKKEVFQHLRMIILIDTNKIEEMCGGNYLILNKSNSIVYVSMDITPDTMQYLQSIKGESKAGYTSIRTKDGNNYYIFYYISDVYPWMYVKAVPYIEIFNKLNNINIIAVVILVILLCISTLVSYFFSIRFFRPIKKVMDLVIPTSGTDRRAFNKNNELENVYSHVQDICLKYEHFQGRYGRLQENYKEYFYERLIMNSDINRVSDFDNLKIDPNEFKNFITVYYKVCYKVDIHTLADMDADQERRINLVVKELVELTLKSFSYRCYPFQVSQDSYSFIVILEKGSFDFTAFSNSLLNHIKADSDYFYVIVAASDVYHDIAYLKNSYEETVNAFDYHSVKRESQFLCYRNIKLYYEYEIKIRSYSEKLKSMLEYAKFDDIEQLFYDLLNQFELQNLPISIIRDIYTGMINNLLDTLHKNFGKHFENKGEILNIFKNLKFCSDKNDFKNLILSVFELVFEAIKDEKKEKSSHYVVDKIVQQIQTGYGEDISLKMLAFKYNISPEYLSKIFKDSTGINFSEYLKTVRMEKAKSLLQQSKAKVMEIAMQVGYNDPSIFIKVFKKEFGISPNEYRKLNRT